MTEPTSTIERDGRRITLLGTAHVSRASAEAVRDQLRTGRFDAVAVELCPGRFDSLTDPDAVARMDLFQVIRKGQAPAVASQLALGAYQQRLAEEFGIEPGAEMRAAVDEAREADLPVLLIDRDVGTTLRRVYRNVPWWRKFGLLGGLLGSLLSREKVSEEEVERLKEGDVLESTFAQFAESQSELYEPLIRERDRYMAARLEAEGRESGYQNILAVIGAGHMKGITADLQAGVADPEAEIRDLDSVPAGGGWWKWLPWLIVALVITGFVIGFSRSPELGWQLVGDWVLINGTLSALGALIALGHPLTVVTAALAAPLTSLNPTIGAGMVTAAAELYFRRPTVGDFARLRQDSAHPGGWWRNRVTRVLLVFLFSSIGSAIGTYLAGFRIFGRLVG